MTDKAIVESTDDEKDQGRGSDTFLSIFDVPIKNNSSRNTQTAEDLQDFDPKNLFKEFSNLAEQERIEHEKNEAEIADKLSSYSNLSEELEDLRANLADINLSEQEARQLPHQLAELTETRDNLSEKLTEFTTTGQNLETNIKDLTAKVANLKKFLEDFNRLKADNVKKFGGGDKGEERFEQLTNKTRLAISQNEQQIATTEAKYQDWKIQSIEALAPILKNLKTAIEGEKITSEAINELKADFDIFIKHREELNARTVPIIEKINEKQALINNLLEDQRIPERINKYESMVTKRQDEFVESILNIFDAQSTPEKYLIKKIGESFYKVELSKINQAASPAKKAESAANLAQTLTRTLNKIKGQANIDLDQLYNHLKDLNNNGALPPSSKGYNDVLFLAYCLGLTGQSNKALEPFRAEGKAVHTDNKEIELYVDQRLKSFLPVLTTLKAGFDVFEAQPPNQPAIFGNWLKELKTILSNSNQTDNQLYSRLHKELSAIVREFITDKKQSAQDQARQVELRLRNLLKQLDQTVADQEANSTKLIKLDSFALTIEQAQEFANEATKLTQEYNSLGPIKLGNSAKKLQDEIDRFSKLLLLKVPDLRKASEIVNYDLGRIDVSAPETIQPKLDELADQLKARRLEAKENQVKKAELLTELKNKVKTDVLNNNQIEIVINSPWLDQSYISELINLYAKVESEFINI